MSEQTGGKHGPAEDEAIKRQDRAELQEQATLAELLQAMGLPVDY